MIVFPKSGAVYFDVDDTLVMWGHVDRIVHEELVWVVDHDGERVGLLPHKSHIAQLKRYAEGGSWTVVVWSQGGGDWAQRVIEALGLQNYVDVCLTKPVIYYDDLNVKSFMPDSTRRHHDIFEGKL